MQIMILHCNKKMNPHFSSFCITSDGVIFVCPAGRNRTNLNKSFKNLYDLKRFVKFLAKRLKKRLTAYRYRVPCGQKSYKSKQIFQKIIIELFDLKRFVKFLAKRRKVKSAKFFLQKVFAKQKKTVYICDINKTDQLYGKNKTRQPPVSAVEVR